MSSGTEEGIVLPLQPLQEKKLGNEETIEPEEYLEPNTLTRKNKRQYDRRKPFHDSGVVDMDNEDFMAHHPGMNGGQSIRGYSGEPRWSSQSSSPSSPVSPISPVSPVSPVSPGSSRPPSYKSNPPRPPSSPPVEDYTVPSPYNEYEELPNLRYNNPNYKYHEVSGVHPESIRRPSPGTSSHLGPMNRSTENLCQQMNNSVHEKPQPPSFRRRQNPLYEEKENEVKRAEKGGAAISEMCILCLLLIIGVVALAALILVILDLSGLIRRRPYSSDSSVFNTNNTDMGAMMQRLQEMEKKYSHLEKYVMNMNKSANLKFFENASDEDQAKNYAALETLLSQHGLNLTRIENRLQTFGSEISTFNSSVMQQLAEIKKMPGPRGPPGPQGLKGNPGAGNMTRCRYRDKSHGSSVNSPTTNTAWAPDATELRDWVIMGLECSTTGGDRALLKVRPHPDSPKESQFMCQCLGKDTSASTARYCYIYIFECPRIS